MYPVWPWAPGTVQRCFSSVGAREELLEHAVGGVEEVFGQVVAGQHEPRLEAAPHAVDHGLALVAVAPLERQQVDFEDLAHGVNASDGGRATVERVTGDPPVVNTAGRPPVWMNTTSSPAPSGRRRRCRAGRRNPCRCTCGRAPSRRGAPPTRSPRRRPWSARRSRRRASGRRPRRRRRRSRRRRRPSSVERVPAASAATSGRPAIDTLGDADREHRAAARPARRPHQRPPGDEPGVGAAARRREHDRRRLDAGGVALVDQLGEGGGVAERPVGGAAADRDRVGRLRRRRRARR